jgi:hypothetical protein
MKLVIEINDEALRNAVKSQCDAAIAALSREIIQADAKEVISKALQRIDWTGTAEREARSLLKGKVDEAFNEVLGNQRYDRHESIRKLVQDAAIAAIKDAK